MAIRGIEVDINKAKMIYLVQRIRTSVLVHDTSATFLTRIAVVAIGIGSNVVTARYLGPEGRGMLAVLTTVTGIAVQFGNFGLHSSNTYFVAKNREILPELLGNTVWLSLIGGAIISLFVWGILYFNPRFAGGISLSLLFVTLLSIPFSLLFLLGSNILLGIQMIKAYNLFDLLNKLIVFLTVVIALTILGQGLYAIVSITAFFTIIFSLIVLKSLCSVGDKPPRFDVTVLKQTLPYGFKAYVVALFAFLLRYADLLMVQYMLGPAQAGYYSIARSMADMLYVLPMAVGMILFPRLSALRDERVKWLLTERVAAIMGLVMVILSLFGLIFAKPVVHLLFGSDFLSSVPAFTILAIAMIFYGINNIISIYLAASGFPLFAIYIWAFIGVLNIVLNILVIPLWGIMGASSASLISYSAILFLQYVYALRRKRAG